ncbi:MAG: hypothetical protein VKL41_00860 [Snowella sp.]|nr:hypothetical protein [Snowella sp.]
MKTLKLLLLIFSISKVAFSQKSSHWIDKLNLYDIKLPENQYYMPSDSWIKLKKDGTFELSRITRSGQPDNLLEGTFKKAGNSLVMTMKDNYLYDFRDGRKEKLAKVFTIKYNDVNNSAIYISNGYMKYDRSLWDGQWKWDNSPPHFYFKECCY